MVNNSRLDDFFAGEYTPCYCIHVIIADILSDIIFNINCLISDHLVRVKMQHKGFQKLRRYEELIICLLVDIAMLGAPSVDWVGRQSSVYFWLRIYS